MAKMVRNGQKCSKMVENVKNGFRSQAYPTQTFSNQAYPAACFKYVKPGQFFSSWFQFLSLKFTSISICLVQTKQSFLRAGNPTKNIDEGSLDFMRLTPSAEDLAVVIKLQNFWPPPHLWDSNIAAQFFCNKSTVQVHCKIIQKFTYLLNFYICFTSIYAEEKQKQKSHSEDSSRKQNSGN